MPQKPIRGSGKSPDHILLSINGDAATTMCVTWRTDTTVTTGFICYRKAGDTAWQKAAAAYHAFNSDIDTNHIFSVPLTQLAPDTLYEYTCGSDTHRSDPVCFSTAPEKLTKFKFLCVADQQKGDPHEKPDYSYFNRMLKKALRAHPDARFVLTGGDNTDCGQHEVQWNGLFASGLVGIADRIPLMMSVGNHDNRGFADYKNGIGRYYAEPAEFFNTQFSGAYPNNGPANWKTENYSFDYGNVHIVVLGVNGPEEVRDWALQDLAQTNKPWKLGVYHFPICYSGVDCQNYDAYPVMREAFEGFDVVFSGHEHNFSRSFPLKNEELFAKPSEGTVHYMLGNSNQNPPGSWTMAKVWHAAFYVHEEQNAMIAVAEVDGDKLTLTSVLDDGRVVDSCTINKAADTITPPALPPLYNRTRMLFKGMNSGLSQASTPCEKKDGIWYVPLAVLIGFIGGRVEKREGEAELAVYGHTAVFREGEDVAQTDRGALTLPGKVYRGHRGQLYIPADGCAAFEMRWAYAPRNNFISFEHESEEKPITEQP